MKISLLATFLFLSIGLWPYGTGREGAEIKKTSLPLPANPEDYEYIRIALANGVPEITISTDSPFYLKDNKGRFLMQGEKIPAAKVKPTAAGLQMGNHRFIENPIFVESRGAGIKVNGKLYRHGIVVWRDDARKISVGNEIAIEDYLRGVLPWEANPAWTPEALKAQAIVSRTYAVFKTLENQAQRFHLTKDVLSQVYGGKSLEHPSTDRAIKETEGLVVTYKGKIFPAYFHSTCGGATTHAEYLWDVEPHPSLRGVPCPYCRASKHYEWSAQFSVTEIQKNLSARGFKMKSLTALRVGDVDETGRAKNFILDYDGKSVKLHSNDFRIWMNPGKFKSTLISSLQKKGNGYEFRGRGWGHGVGLCQYGMKHLGEQGIRAAKILQHYYPESEIRKLGSIPSPSVSGVPVPAVRPSSPRTEQQSGFWENVSEKFQEWTGQ